MQRSMSEERVNKGSRCRHSGPWPVPGLEASHFHPPSMSSRFQLHENTYKHNHAALRPTIRHSLLPMLPFLFPHPNLQYRQFWTPSTQSPTGPDQPHWRRTQQAAERINLPATARCTSSQVSPVPSWQGNILSAQFTHLSSSLNCRGMTDRHTHTHIHTHSHQLA